MSITDTQFRLGVGAAGIALVAGLTLVSFCGSVSLPPKPAPPAGPSGTSSELLTKSSATQVAYLDFLARDAAAAGAPLPTLEDMSRTLPYRADGARHVLEVGAPPVEIAGVRLRALHLAEGLGLEVENATGSDVAYNVVTSPIPAMRAGNVLLPFNAMTIAKGGRETRAECLWRDGIALAVTRVETFEVAPLSAWYLRHVPPSVVGIESRLARSHLPPADAVRCAFAQSQTVRSGLERGEIGWRDLVDFYARHRCQTYQFPPTYRALKTDGERSMPAVAAGM